MWLTSDQGFLLFGSTVVAYCSSGIYRISVMFFTFSSLVVGDTWVSQLRRRSSRKSYTCSLRLMLVKPIEEK